LKGKYEKWVRIYILMDLKNKFHLLWQSFMKLNLRKGGVKKIQGGGWEKKFIQTTTIVCLSKITIAKLFLQTSTITLITTKPQKIEA
jgi:hypothetical protein